MQSGLLFKKVGTRLLFHRQTGWDVPCAPRPSDQELQVMSTKVAAKALCSYLSMI